MRREEIGKVGPTKFYLSAWSEYVLRVIETLVRILTDCEECVFIVRDFEKSRSDAVGYNIKIRKGLVLLNSSQNEVRFSGEFTINTSVAGKHPWRVLLDKEYSLLFGDEAYTFRFTPVLNEPWLELVISKLGKPIKMVAVHYI